MLPPKLRSIPVSTRIRPLSTARSCDTIDTRGEKEWRAKARPRWLVVVTHLAAAVVGAGICWVVTR